MSKRKTKTRETKNPAADERRRQLAESDRREAAGRLIGFEGPEPAAFTKACEDLLSANTRFRGGGSGRERRRLIQPVLEALVLLDTAILDHDEGAPLEGQIPPAVRDVLRDLPHVVRGLFGVAFSVPGDVLSDADTYTDMPRDYYKAGRITGNITRALPDSVRYRLKQARDALSKIREQEERATVENVIEFTGPKISRNGHTYIPIKINGKPDELPNAIAKALLELNAGHKVPNPSRVAKALGFDPKQFDPRKGLKILNAPRVEGIDRP